MLFSPTADEAVTKLETFVTYGVFFTDRAQHIVVANEENRVS